MTTVRFTSRTIETRDGEPVEVLIMAKAGYEERLDAHGKWKKGFARAENVGMLMGEEGFGLIAEMDAARRQVRVADGRPVQWWCLEEAAAEAFNEEFRRRDELRGRIEAVYRPMPEEPG